MTTTILLICIIIFIFLCIIAVYFYDRHLIKEIELYEKKLHEKGILKRHFISKDQKRK
jgi:predicted Holliday junction resolvase-like endonuclease